MTFPPNITKHLGNAAVMADPAQNRRAALLKEIQKRKEQLEMPLDFEIWDFSFGP